MGNNPNHVTEHDESVHGIGKETERGRVFGVAAAEALQASFQNMFPRMRPVVGSSPEPTVPPLLRGSSGAGYGPLLGNGSFNAPNNLKQNLEGLQKTMAGVGYSAQMAGFNAMILTSSIQGAASAVTQLQQPIEQMFGYFKQGLDQVKVIGLKQFKAFESYETERITAANDLRTSFTPSKYDRKPILNIDQATSLVDKLRPKVIEMATQLPGSNSEYLTANKFTLDIAGRAAKGDLGKLEKYSLELTKVTGLLGSVSGKGAAVVNTAINQYMATGRLSSQSALGRAFPEFKNFLADTKQGATGTEQQRADKLTKGLDKFFPKTVTDKYQDTFATRKAALEESIFGETGLFSFVRKIEGGDSIGGRIKKIWDKLTPDFTPLLKVVDRGVVALDKLIAPWVNRVSGMMKGMGDRFVKLADKDFLNPSKLFGALTGLSPDQGTKLIKTIFDVIIGFIKSFGEGLRGENKDPIVKELVAGISGIFREMSWQKGMMTIENAPALAVNDPMAALSAVGSVFQILTGVIMALGALPGIALGIGSAWAFVAPIFAAIGTGMLMVGTALLAAGVAITGLPVWIVAAIGIALAFIVGLIISQWTNITKFIQSTWQKLMDFFSSAIANLNPGKWVQNVASAVGIVAPAGAPAPPAGSTAPSSRKAEVSLRINDERGTLNSVTRENLVSALGEALSSQYGSLFEPGFT